MHGEQKAETHTHTHTAWTYSVAPSSSQSTATAGKHFWLATLNMLCSLPTSHMGQLL